MSTPEYSGRVSPDHQAGQGELMNGRNTRQRIEKNAGRIRDCFWCFPVSQYSLKYFLMSYADQIPFLGDPLGSGNLASHVPACPVYSELVSARSWRPVRHLKDHIQCPWSWLQSKNGHQALKMESSIAGWASMCTCTLYCMLIFMQWHTGTGKNCHRALPWWKSQRKLTWVWLSPKINRS